MTSIRVLALNGCIAGTQLSAMHKEMPFSLIDDLNIFFGGFPHAWCVSGGWAIDLFLGRKTRDRCDLDVSIFNPGHSDSVDFFLGKQWTIEGKDADGFRRIEHLSDLDEEIHYFWSFPIGAAFISEYTDNHGNRRISYNREKQEALDYVEVFFDRFEDGEFVYRRNASIRRSKEKSVIQKAEYAFLAPELVLLYKSKRVRPTDNLDLQVALAEMDSEQRDWLRNALLIEYGKDHAWIRKLKNA